jgi:hypothetical protein
MRSNVRYMIVFAVWLTCAGTAFAQGTEKIKPKDDTETVYTTFYVVQGKEAEFLKVLEKAWPTYAKHGMVLKEPHIILGGTDDKGRPYFIEILRWKDHEAPDHAPADVQAVWDQMTALCERRDGHRRIEFYEVQIVPPKQ